MGTCKENDLRISPRTPQTFCQTKGAESRGVKGLLWGNVADSRLRVLPPLWRWGGRTLFWNLGLLKGAFSGPPGQLRIVLLSQEQRS